MTDKTYFHHIRTGLKRPTTVAYRVNGTQVVYNYAQCSDKDHFCKKVGRDVSSGRLSKGEGKFINFTTAPRHADIGNVIFHELSSVA